TRCLTCSVASAGPSTSTAVGRASSRTACRWWAAAGDRWRTPKTRQSDSAITASGADVRGDQLLLRVVEEPFGPQVREVVAPQAVLVRLLVDADVLVGEGAADLPQRPRLLADVDGEQARPLQRVVDQPADLLRQALILHLDGVAGADFAGLLLGE